MRFNVDDLIEKKLVYVRHSPCGKYRLLKYTRKVFYDNLWHLDSRLLQCRGIVVDKDDNVIMYPFKKVFNLGENNTGTNVPDNQQVIAVRKVNGYLAQAAVVDGELIVTSSGSFDSKHAHIAKKMIKECLASSQARSSRLHKDYTYMFEICHKEDPHIVEENEGVYLIGVREMDDHEMINQNTLKMIAWLHGFECSEFTVLSFSDAVTIAKSSFYEGYMLLDYYDENNVIAKVKSHHYLCKKALMRIGSAQLDIMFDNPKVFKEHRLEEEFYGIHQYILDNYTKDEYRMMTEQHRRKLIEDYFNDNNL